MSLRCIVPLCAQCVAHISAEDDDGTTHGGGRDSDAKSRRSSGRPIRKLRNSSLNSTESSAIEQSVSDPEEDRSYNRRSTNTHGLSRKSTNTGYSEGQSRPQTHGRAKMAVFTK